MLKSSTLISKIVINPKGANTVGTVFSIIYNKSLNKATHLVILYEDDNDDIKTIPVSEIVSNNLDAIIIRSSARIMPLSVMRMEGRLNSPINKKCYNTDGIYQGVVRDVNLDENFNVLGIVVDELLFTPFDVAQASDELVITNGSYIPFKKKVKSADITSIDEGFVEDIAENETVIKGKTNEQMNFNKVSTDVAMDKGKEGEQKSDQKTNQAEKASIVGLNKVKAVSIDVEQKIERASAFNNEIKKISLNETAKEIDIKAESDGKETVKMDLIEDNIVIKEIANQYQDYYKFKKELSDNTLTDIVDVAEENFEKIAKTVKEMSEEKSKSEIIPKDNASKEFSALNEKSNTRTAAAATTIEILKNDTINASANSNSKIIDKENYFNREKIKTVKITVNEEINNDYTMLRNEVPPYKIVANYDFLLGRVVKNNIYNYDMKLIITKGTVINNDIVKIARYNNKLVELVSSSAVQ